MPDSRKDQAFALAVVSVIMPVYNAEHYVAEAVESILAQTFRDFEFIIIEDGSTDGSLSILQRYAKQDSRIRLVSRPNKGLTKSLNEGIAMARGEFIARMDADDISLCERLCKQVSYLRSHPECVALGCNVFVVDPDGQQLGELSVNTEHERIDAVLLGGAGVAICHPASMLRLEAVKAVGGYREEYAVAQDRDLFLRLAEYGCLANLPTVLFKYRESLAAMSLGKREEQSRAATRSVEDACRRRGLELSRQACDRRVRSLSAPDAHTRWAWMALKAGNVSTARKHALASVMRAPFSMKSWRVAACAIRGH